jgi:hypothetical protein
MAIMVLDRKVQKVLGGPSMCPRYPSILIANYSN